MTREDEGVARTFHICSYMHYQELSTNMYHINLLTQHI